jgi:hypothetical protein
MFPEVDSSGCCVACGKQRVVGDYPKCPHETGKTADFFQDSIPGGMVIENGVSQPTTVYSHTEARLLREQNGWRMKERWAPSPGTDVDPAGVQDPSKYQDSYTLQAGAALMLRQSKVDTSQMDLDKLFVNKVDETLDYDEARQKLQGTGADDVLPAREVDSAVFPSTE